MLEKILQEINMVTKRVVADGPRFVMLDDVERIIRSHMEDDGWIPVEEEFPKKSGYYWIYFETPFLGYTRKAFWDSHGKCFRWPSNGRKVKDNPIAWRPYYAPEPYRPKEEN